MPTIILTYILFAFPNPTGWKGVEDVKHFQAGQTCEAIAAQLNTLQQKRYACSTAVVSLNNAQMLAAN